MTESKLDTTRRIRAELVERWPALFNEGKPVPLAIGIRKTLLAAMPKVTDELIGRVLRSWCFRPQYLAALTAGADRHGLEGIVGTVSDEAANLAAEQLPTLHTHLAEKAKAKREAVQIEEARQAEAKKKKAEQAEPPKTKPPAPPSKPKPTPPAMPKPAPVEPPKPSGPVIVVKKRRLPPTS